MARFANRNIYKMTFNQWINVEYGIVKKQYKSELTDSQRARLKREYKEYLGEVE